MANHHTVASIHMACHSTGFPPLTVYYMRLRPWTGADRTLFVSSGSDVLHFQNPIFMHIMHIDHSINIKHNNSTKAKMIHDK